ncbi:MAG: sulfur carrier protein ThiS [Candidatus Riflebacteria bacterium]|nr:sulfur carrier protein ThiS [Candidatus Riflebacteria bacterium]
MIMVNGKPSECTAGMSIRELLNLHRFIFPLLIIKINGEFVPRERYETTKVPENALVDVVHLISGG